MRRLELWGGVECTVNRVGDTFHDQLQASGHDRRSDDLERFAALGLRRLRYPVLWERSAPHHPQSIDLGWAETRLHELRELGLDPIVGLVHHGSGPRYTSLLDEKFPELLAQYGRAVAERFPWVELYTPINEPLTTGRFSALYGHWYPHRRDGGSFVRVMLLQCRAIALAMQAIRTVNPAARLIQTDDLGFTTSTPKLAYQAAFDNERRWLSWDLLCGKVDAQHALWRYLIACGASVQELVWFREHPCPPDVIGINHYLTSDRHLSEDLQQFPEESWGGNGKDNYADVAAVRVLPAGNAGVCGALHAAWERYHRPLAITEAHLGCTREEQLRWLAEVWQHARRALESGIDVRAVTVWSLLGSYDWNSLLTRITGHYEPGVFDVRSDPPRPTALAKLTRELAAGGDAQQAGFLAEPGWWRRDIRLYCAANEPRLAAACKQGPGTPGLLIAGAGGTLGRALARVCEVRGLRAHVATRAELDVCDADSVERMLDAVQPWGLINAAGYVRVDDAESDGERCYAVNSRGAALLAAACARRRIAFLTFSSDLVFDGSQSDPYVESNAAAPLSIYGLSKAAAERAVLQAYDEALVVRTSAFFGPWDEANFVTCALRALRAGKEFAAVDDLVVSPTYVPDLAHAALDLLIDGEHGIWHLVNQGSVSWLQLAQQAAELAKLHPARLRACSAQTLKLAAPRPRFSVLTSERGLVMPTLENALERYIGQCSPADFLAALGQAASSRGAGMRSPTLLRPPQPTV